VDGAEDADDVCAAEAGADGCSGVVATTWADVVGGSTAGLLGGAGDTGAGSVVSGADDLDRGPSACVSGGGGGGDSTTAGACVATGAGA
jgi:hypothetical protein